MIIIEDDQDTYETVVNYERPSYSKKKVQNSGKALRKGKESSSDWSIFNNWRSSHAYPLDNLSEELNAIARSVDPNVLIAKRLKRSPSIINKLKLQPSMSLSTMQDIGGCRAIVDSNESVYNVSNRIQDEVNSHNLVSVTDYIKQPKPSGYRGIHFVYKFNSQALSPEHDGLMVEMQVRSMTQHYWATAVETLGAYLKQALKSNQGDEQYLLYFSAVGDLFAIYDQAEVFNTDLHLGEILQIIKVSEATLKIRQKLAAFSHVTKMIASREHEADYYLIILNMLENSVRIEAISRENLKEANKRYTQLEMRFKNDAKKDIAFVSARKLTELRRTYPNYFSDTKEFIQHLNSVVKEFKALPEVVEFEKQNRLKTRVISAKGSHTRQDKKVVLRRSLKKLKANRSKLCRHRRALIQAMKHESDPKLLADAKVDLQRLDCEVVMLCKQTANMEQLVTSVFKFRKSHSLKRKK
ncbi:RelA/SpoT domain-containing protein [Vibrio coralliirubri]|uniref:RelA/SpoT domain-containing protein n=1 Tax=Vibrio coralliirubri TaxID=1516159 RepID=UPI00076A6464|nr:RelA/SpoT domain-containing protein [Vibrio coralliirubri]